MRLLTWNRSYVTGIDTIDAGHRKLVAKINRLHEELDANKRTILGFFHGLEKEVERNFRQEEALTRSHACAKHDDHKRYHDRLRDDISDLAEFFATRSKLIVSNYRCVLMLGSSGISERAIIGSETCLLR